MRSSNVQLLFDACAVGNVDGVKALLDAGVPANARNANGQTPLIVAARSGRLDVVRLLLESGARSAARTDPLLGLQEPLSVEDINDTFERATASTMSPEVLRAGDDDSLESTAREEEARALEVLDSTDDLLCEAGPLLTASVCGHFEVVDALLDAGVDPNPTDWIETPPLVGAAAQGHEHIVARLLEAGAYVDGGTGFTALEEAVVHRHVRVVRRLLAADADVDRRNEDGGTALMLAAATGCLPIVQLLVEAGADVNIVTDGEAALSCAAAYGHLDVFAYLLPRCEPAVQARGDIALGAYLEYVAQL